MPGLVAHPEERLVNQLLSEKSRPVVEATAGVVAENATTITTQFYGDMFAAHPELRSVFNMANQAVGEQPKALAASVVAYAVHLIDPDAPDFTPVMQRIAHKHVSLGITAPQYTIVGHYLLSAVGKVLGEAVTPEVAEAWNEVYWLFGSQLIAEEAKLYALAGTDPNSPWRDYEVIERVEENEEVFSLVLAPVDGDLPEREVGQYVTLNVEVEPGWTQPRQYTISGVPGAEAFRVTIKRELGKGDNPDGMVSTWLYDNARAGTILAVSQPAGDVVLQDTDVPLLLISAGVGITPMAAILEDLAQRRPDRQVRVLHADRSRSLHPLRTTVREDARKLADAKAQFWYEDLSDIASEEDASPSDPPVHEGFMDLTEIDVPTDAHVFMCGTLPFMRAVREQLVAKGVSPTNISYEVFGPDLWAQNPDAAA